MTMLNQYNQYKTKFPLDSIKANELREQAFKLFSEQGLPTRNEEAWKFTSLAEFKAVEWQIPTEENFLNHEQMVFVSKYLPSDFHNIVFVNGVLNRTLSDSDLPLTQQDLSSSDFAISSEEPDRKLIQLSRAFAAQKNIISIEKHSQLQKPLQIVQLTVGGSSQLIQPVFEIKIAEGCELKLILHRLGIENYKQTTQAFNLDLTVDVAPRAHLKFVNIENGQNQDYSFERIKINLHDHSVATSLDLALGSKISRHYLETQFLGAQADAGIFGLTLLADSQHCDHYTFIRHALGNNQSVQHYKSILTDKSRSVFRGRVRIEQDAQKANSEQLNNNLLISRAASADSIPQLEIYADDVKAGHGSTVGQLNKDEIFYFLSRGISEKQAIQMLSYGYAKELVYKLDHELIQNFIFQILDEKLSEIF